MRSLGHYVDDGEALDIFDDSKRSKCPRTSRSWIAVVILEKGGTPRLKLAKLQSTAKLVQMCVAGWYRSDDNVALRMVPGDSRVCHRDSSLAARYLYRTAWVRRGAGKSKRFREASGEILATTLGAEDLSLRKASTIIERESQVIEKRSDFLDGLGRLLKRHGIAQEAVLDLRHLSSNDWGHGCDRRGD